MISTIRTSLIVLCLHIILGTIVYGASLPPQQDFQFETGTDEELQEYHKCPNGEDSILLTFVLKSQNWNNIGRDKKERAVLKLSKFFGIPKDLIKVENINRKDIYEIGKHSTQHGINYVEANKRLGKIEFLIGCGKSYFASVESLIKQISDQMRDELIDDLTGFKFGWWAIWHQSTHSRRRRDNNLAEGSGDDNQVDDNDDYDDYEEDEYADVTTEVSSSPNAVANSDDSRPHRHHHGDNSSESASSSRTPTEKVSETTESDYDYNYDEDEFKDVKPDVIVPSPGSDEAASEETIATTASQAPTTGSTTTERTTSTIIVTEPVSLNQSPMIRNRLQKLAITAGKWFTMTIPMDLFHDPEDGRDIRIVVLDDRGNELKSTSWLQFNPAKREIYGLPLEEDISKWQFQVKGIDSENLSVTETLDITVQHYKSFRSANHEIRTHVDLLNKFETPLNWQSRLLQSIADVSGDGSFDNIIVREIKMRDNQNAKKYYFVYSNETLPKDKCPDAELKQLIAKTNMDRLNGLLKGDIKIEKIEGNLIGQCAKSPEPTKHTVPHIGTKKNFAPVPRNQVDRVNAVALQLLVFKVPQDTFYDQEDLTDLKLSLLNQDGTPLDANHWLQFDSKNHEFFGVPKMSDIGSRDYILEAQDREGEKAMDALIVTVTYPSHRDPGATFEMELKMPVQQFDTASMQRRFIEQLGWLFNDQDTQDIQIVNIKEDAISKNVVISYHNTSLYRPYGVCPLEDINILKDVVLHRDGKIRERARSIFGNDLSLIRFNVNKRGPCDGEPIIHHEVTPIKNEDKKHKSGFSNDYLLTYVLPGVIILAMLLLAAIIACVLHKRKYSGKMELGSEEERKSFRSKGIPVIFQDELDEKPELGNKSPIILKDEKPPLLPPTYNQTNPDDEDNMDEYVPPPGVVSGGRESRGKSPITPSYRKPPPYVSP